VIDVNMSLSFTETHRWTPHQFGNCGCLAVRFGSVRPLGGMPPDRTLGQLWIWGVGRCLTVQVAWERRALLGLWFNRANGFWRHLGLFVRDRPILPARDASVGSLGWGVVIASALGVRMFCFTALGGFLRKPKGLTC
jgi:hypothetical protein